MLPFGVLACPDAPKSCIQSQVSGLNLQHLGLLAVYSAPLTTIYFASTVLIVKAANPHRT